METKSRSMKFTDLKDMLQKTGEVYGDRPAYILKSQNGGLDHITHKEFRNEINALGTALVQMGLKDKRIAVISENRYEWELSYLAIVTGVGVVVPLDKALPDNELESLILRSEVEAIFYSEKYDNIMNTLREKKNTNLKYFISMDLQENTNGIYSEKMLIEKGKKLLEEGNKEFINAKINNEEMGIMLFTSGTTSMSKAVMLSHKNIVTNIMDIIHTFDLDETDIFLSFLPLHHVFECTVGFLYPVSIGGAIAFCEGVKHMADNIKEFDITAMISVPAVFDIIYRKVMKTIEKKGKLGAVKKGIKISQTLLKFKIDVRQKLFREIHESLGPKLKLVVTGGAALDPETEKGFNDLSSYASSTIKSYLSDMIYDSSVLLVVISPTVSQSDWVDWEIGYALRNTSRDGRASKRNGIVCVIQKDSYTGSSSWAYDYKGDVYEAYLPRRIVQNMQETYGALSIFERPNRDYCVIVTESTFMSDPQKYIERAYERSCYPYIYPIVIK